MRDIKEIEYWISKLENGESSFPNYAKLADLYAIRSQMTGVPAAYPQSQIAAYSEAAEPAGETLGRYGDSDFLRAVDGKDAGAAWSVMNELMETLRVVNPRAYDGVMRKLGRL